MEIIPDWIGTNEGWEGYEWKSYEEAKKFVHALNLKSTDEWRDYTLKNKLPYGIPTYPNRTYKEMGLVWVIGWVLEMFLIVIKSFIHFKEGREIVHQLGLKSSTEWKKYTESEKYDKMIPRAPQHDLQRIC